MMKEEKEGRVPAGTTQAETEPTPSIVSRKSIRDKRRRPCGTTVVDIRSQIAFARVVGVAAVEERLGFVNQAPPQPPRDGRTAARSILIPILRCTSTSAIGRRHEARKL
ncbi:hypothetical protein CDV36_011297 [Fusarium kuroshium]|uniref:Uncharacterized protein n=1 Tax=Fusarium kuroshium TaxID=2010991 RepID=A0A3M2RUW8_9HYPO|nr:hypothetical protein CDV36_011297 [Fusarium kuroshium]